MLKNFDYKVPKSENCVLININNWLKPKGRLLAIQKISGRNSTTYITEALKTNITENLSDKIKEGSTILLSKVASEIAPYRSFTMEDGEQYFNAPVSQIMGTFKNNDITLENLQMSEGKLLIRKIEDTQDSPIALMNNNVMIGEVVKISEGSSKIEMGDIILVKDNVSTEIAFDGEKFYALEERMVVGVFNGSFSLASMTFLNESVLMKPHTPKKVLNSTLIISPEINLEELDYSDMYNRDLFKIHFLDKALTKLSEGDIVLVNRDYTNYVYFNQEKYFIINGYEYIESIIKE